MPSLDVVAGIVATVSHVDDRILFDRLSNAEMRDWRKAREVLRSSLRRMENGGGNAPPLTYEPVAKLRDLLAKCPDEIVPRSMERLAFIEEESLRQSIGRDIDWLEELILDEQWKAATVLGGSVVEANLLAMLLEPANEQAARSEVAKRAAEPGGVAWRKDRKDPSVGKDLDDLALKQLIDLAQTLSIIKENIAHVCDGARDFRNLIHPGRERATAPCDRGTAWAARSAVENLLAVFSGERKAAGHGQDTDKLHNNAAK